MGFWPDLPKMVFFAVGLSQTLDFVNVCSASKFVKTFGIAKWQFSLGCSWASAWASSLKILYCSNPDFFGQHLGST